MGNAASHKENLEPPKLAVNLDQSQQEEGDVSMKEEDGATPVILKSRHHIMALVDPRSPTQEISRTPIALEEQQKQSKRESLLNLKLTKLKDSTTPNNTLNPFVDPRSPTEDIDRTPIRYAKAKDGLMQSTKINFQDRIN